MSLRALRIINSVAFWIVLAGLVIGLVALAVQLDVPNLAYGATGITLMILVPAILLGRAARARFRVERVARKKRGTVGFGIVTRAFHQTQSVSEPERSIAFAESVFADEPGAHLVDVRRCRDCGHSEILLKVDGRRVQLFTLPGDDNFVPQMWVFGLFGLWVRDESLDQSPHGER